MRTVRVEIKGRGTVLAKYDPLTNTIVFGSGGAAIIAPDPNDPSAEFKVFERGSADPYNPAEESKYEPLVPFSPDPTVKS